MPEIGLALAMRTIRSVAVFCGSNLGASQEFADGARTMGRTLANAGITLVYGGTKNGLMGVLCDTVLTNGGQVHGVITQGLHHLRRAHPGLTQIEIARTLRSRKERMAAMADAFIALPGGIGTIDQFLDVWSMNQLLEIDKPMGILNSAGFYSPFFAFINHMVEARFLSGPHRDFILVDADPGALIEKLRRQARVDVPKAMRPDPPERLESAGK